VSHTLGRYILLRNSAAEAALMIASKGVFLLLRAVGLRGLTR